MIDFYALTSPNVQKIYIMLEETKSPYKEHFVDVWQGDQFNPDFRGINLNAKIRRSSTTKAQPASLTRCSSSARS